MQSNVITPRDTERDQPIECRDNVVEGLRPSQIARAKFGNKYGWIAHDSADGRAAQRRRHRAKFDPDVRCAVCGKWAKSSTTQQIGSRRFCVDCV